MKEKNVVEMTGVWISLMVNSNSKPKRGFTLIELLVVIAIIGILAALGVNAYKNAQAQGRDARRKSDFKQIQTALELYYNNNRNYPSGCAWSSWSCWPGFIGADYIREVPKDPRDVDLGNCATTPNCYLYTYCQLSGGEKYAVVANLENSNDPDKKSSAPSDCPHGGPNWYWVIAP